MANVFQLRCARCQRAYPRERLIFQCDDCGGLIEVLQDLAGFTTADLKPQGEGVWAYARFLPVQKAANRVSLGEAGTPLVRAARLAEAIGIKDLTLKCEFVSPTASFKDRGMSVAVSMARELGIKRIFCASTGNTAASLSAYASRAGVKAVLVLPENVPLGKLSQTLLHAPTILRVKGGFDTAMRVVTEIGRRGEYLINSINPYRIVGQKTVIFEILEQRGSLPDHVLFPVGSGGFVSAAHQGASALVKLGAAAKAPRLGAIQAAKVAPIVSAVRNETAISAWTGHETTIAGGINIGDPMHGQTAVEAVLLTNGLAETVTDEEILNAQRDLAVLEGIGVEPTAAVPVAGLRKLARTGRIGSRESVTCILTGHALKDPGIIMARQDLIRDVAADADEILRTADSILK